MKKKKESRCIDALVWIGNMPTKYPTVDDFVKEAQLRGCCRQLPFIPVWMKSGKTKIFLAHRDTHKTQKRGSIFGYFVLHQIEIITREDVARTLRDPGNIKNLWPRNIMDYVSCVKTWMKEGHSESEIRIRLNEKLQRKYMIDVARGKTNSRPSAKKYSKHILDLIEDILGILLSDCLPWPDDDEDYGIVDFIGDILNILFCSYPGPPIRGEGHRMCSLRKGPGAVYAVDAMCATVHSLYRRLLHRHLLSESKKSGKSQLDTLESIYFENKRAWKDWQEFRKNNKWNVEDLLRHYKGPFNEAVKMVFDVWKLKYPIDQRIQGNANNFGELIVFKKPFPILEKAPQVAFKGICRIDGDKLIDQIAKHKSKRALVVKLFYCGKDKFIENAPIKTKEQLISHLSQELNLNKACARLFLDKLSFKTKEQLEHFGYFRLPRIGSISLQDKKNSKITFSPFKEISGKGTLYAYKTISNICITQASGGKPQKITNKSDLVEWLKNELPVTKTCAAQFLSLLSLTAREQIKIFKMFRLPGIGTIFT